MMPVAKPFLPWYHFWTQDWMAGYRKAVPSPAGMLKLQGRARPQSPGSRAAPKISPPSSRAVPQRAAHRGPCLSCKKPPMTHPAP